MKKTKQGTTPRPLAKRDWDIVAGGISLSHGLVPARGRRWGMVPIDPPANTTRLPHPGHTPR